MIKASTPAFAGLVRRLAAKARSVASAHAESTLREKRKDPWRWRSARLLWPGQFEER